MKKQIFIDGHVGTTGLQVADKLMRHDDITILKIDDDKRKDETARKDIYDASDAVILCLPDDAAKAAVQMAAELDIIIIDASTAHRVSDNFTYGLPELTSDHRDKIANARLISNPGCYPTGFLSLVRPLRDAGLLADDVLLNTPAVSGFSGGGNALIASFEAGDVPSQFSYGHNLAHKHNPEMQKFANLKTAPIFMPSVGDFAQGMLVHVPLHHNQMSRSATADDIAQIYQAHFAQSDVITAYDGNDTSQLTEKGFLAADGLAGKDRLEIFTFSNHDTGQIWLTARLDNLGKGASGAAVQNMNIALGMAETAGLSL